MGLNPRTPQPSPRGYEPDGFATSLLLTLAAAYLPDVSLPELVFSTDLHNTCCAAAIFLGSSDHADAHCLADITESRFVGYLVKSQHVALAANSAGECCAMGGNCELCLLRRWLHGKEVSLVVRELQRAANHYRLLHAATIFDGPNLQAFMLGRLPGPHPEPDDDHRSALPSEAA